MNFNARIGTLKVHFFEYLVAIAGLTVVIVFYSVGIKGVRTR